MDPRPRGRGAAADCGSSASASCPSRRWATASSPGRSAPPGSSTDGDWRTTNPRFTGENFQHNLQIADEVEAIAAEAGATPAQVALAWLLAKGDDIAPIPGTRRVSRIEENTAADGIELTAEQISRLDNLTPAAGEPPRRSGHAAARPLTRPRPRRPPAPAAGTPLASTKFPSGLRWPVPRMPCPVGRSTALLPPGTGPRSAGRVRAEIAVRRHRTVIGIADCRQLRPAVPTARQSFQPTCLIGRHRRRRRRGCRSHAGPGCRGAGRTSS